MTKFKDYLTEGSKYKDIDDLDHVLQMIEKDCQKYLKALKSIGNVALLFRGITGRRIDIAAEVTPRKDRMPLDLSKKLHYALNRAFKKSFGWEGRSGVFAMSTGNWSEHDLLFFPVGDFKFIYSPDVGDLYMAPIIRDLKIRGTSFEDDVEKWISDQKYTDKNLGAAILSGHEIMFKVKKYYVINENHVVKVINWIKGR